MNVQLYAPALTLLLLISNSASRAQDGSPAPLKFPPVTVELADFPPAAIQIPDLQKILDGQDSPEIYSVNIDDDAEKRLLKQQINCLYAECLTLESRVSHAVGNIFDLFDAKRRLGDARLEFHKEFEEQRKILTEQIEDARKVENMIAAQVRAGTVSHAAVYKSTCFRIKVELALLRLEKAKGEESSKKQSDYECMNGHDCSSPNILNNYPPHDIGTVRIQPRFVSSTHTISPVRLPFRWAAERKEMPKLFPSVSLECSTTDNLRYL
jgi:hypothetical protein